MFTNDMEVDEDPEVDAKTATDSKQRDVPRRQGRPYMNVVNDCIRSYHRS